ncbi:MAG TPA: hypothetical protein VIQ22_00650, partial [Gammaproteobacteria bacterium]
MNRFITQFNAPLRGLMRWPQWEELQDTLNRKNDGQWYVYYVGEEVPSLPLSVEAFQRFLMELDTLLRRDHQEDYLGIVYADDPAQPGFIKIYDPNNLGAACGSSGHRVLPGWT